MRYGVVLFHTTTSVIRAEKILLKVGLAVKMIPTPREISSDCGISLRFLPSEESGVRQNLTDAHLEFDIFILEGK